MSYWPAASSPAYFVRHPRRFQTLDLSQPPHRYRQSRGNGSARQHASKSTQMAHAATRGPDCCIESRSDGTKWIDLRLTVSSDRPLQDATVKRKRLQPKMGRGSARPSCRSPKSLRRGRNAPSGDNGCGSRIEAVTIESCVEQPVVLLAPGDAR